MNRRELLKGLPLASVAASLPMLVTANPANADSDLLAIGVEFEAAFAREEQARQLGRLTDNWDEWDAAYAHTQTVVDKIERCGASTIEGLKVKARAIQWCYGDDPVRLAEYDTTDIKLAGQIVADLLALT